jgi:hypothetical protein
MWDAFSWITNFGGVCCALVLTAMGHSLPWWAWVTVLASTAWMATDLTVRFYFYANRDTGGMR